MLYKKLQNELLKLETWKLTHDKRLQNKHKKDLHKLNNKLLSQAPPVEENRISQILNNDIDKIRNSSSSKRASPTSSDAFRAFRRSQSIYNDVKNLQFLRESISELDVQNKRLSQVHNKHLNLDLSENEENDNNKNNAVIDGLFVQFIYDHDNNDKITSHKVIINVDHNKKEIRWKRKHDNGDYNESEYDILIECRMPFKDIVDIQTPSKNKIFNKNNNKNQCFSIISDSISLHLQAENEQIMTDFTQKLLHLMELNRRLSIQFKQIN